MGWLNFGKSWVQIIANPAGYVLQRKSPSEAAANYIGKNPPAGILLSGALGFQESRNQWTEACAAQLKSDDVGKTRANSLSACQQAFDKDAAVIAYRQDVAVASAEEKAAIQTQNKKLIAGIGITALFIILLIIILKYTK